MKVIVVILSVVAVVTCGPVASEEPLLRTVVENFVNCVNSDLGLCLKEHALKATERLGTARKLKIIDGVTLLNNNPKEPKSLEPLATEPELRSKQVSERLWDSTTDLLQSSELELSYGGADDEESRSIENDAEEAREGGGKKKKKQIKKKLKMLIPLLLLGKAKAVVLVVLALIVIAASLFKLALLAKIAFIIKLIAIIKALLAKKHNQEESWESHSSWEPHVEHSHVEQSHVEHGHGWEGGWSRSKNDGNSLAYSAYN